MDRVVDRIRLIGQLCRHGQDQQRPYTAAAERLVPGQGLRGNRPGHRQATPAQADLPDEASAHVALGRLLAEADGGRFPDRHATVGQALDKYLEVADLEVSTREAHEGNIRRTTGPVLGEVKIRQFGADSLDALYTALKQCSRLCARLPRTRQPCRPRRRHRSTGWA